MQNILINPTKDIKLQIIGSFVSGEPENNIRDSFLIVNIERSRNDDLIEVLEWANSKPSGSVLSIIEELVLDKI